MKRVAGEIRIDRQRRRPWRAPITTARRHDVVGGEIGAIGLAVRGDLADVREGQADDERHDQQQHRRARSHRRRRSDGSVQRPAQAPRRHREQRHDQRRGDQAATTPCAPAIQSSVSTRLPSAWPTSGPNASDRQPALAGRDARAGSGCRAGRRGLARRGQRPAPAGPATAR